MKKFLSPNISSQGRLMRGATALVLFAACAVAARYSVVLTVILGVSGLFTAFEALRGWCVLRACGIKTKF